MFQFLYFASFVLLAESKRLVLHLLPLSHCDAGYEKTLEEYYHTEGRAIFTSVVDALSLDSTLRFVWSETVFLEEWFQDSSVPIHEKESFKSLVRSGQLEIVNGGFVMHDEAITRYDSQIQQTTLGHDILKQLLGEVSIRSGFQIDPFGPSSFSPTFQALAGTEQVIHDRFSDALKDKFKSEKALEFVWQGNDLLGQYSQVMYHVLDESYSSPSGLDWEDPRYPPDNVNSSNVESFARVLFDIVMPKLQWYRTPNVMLPIGGDFHFENASLQFDNWKRIISHINANEIMYNHELKLESIEIRFSTAKDYFDALALSNTSFPVITGSPSLPLVSHGTKKTWSGFYFQSLWLKQKTRVLEQMHRQSNFLTVQNSKLGSGLDPQRISALMQHHDALPCTSDPHVHLDFWDKLGVAIDSVSDTLSQSILEKLGSREGLWGATKSRVVGGGPYLGQSIQFTNDGSFYPKENALRVQMGSFVPLVISNPLGWTQTRMVHFTATRNDLRIRNKDGIAIPAQSTFLSSQSDSLYQISFEAKDVPPLGLVVYYVETCYVTWSTAQLEHEDCSCVREAERSDENFIENAEMMVYFDENGMTVTQKSNGDTFELEHILKGYDGSQDDVYGWNTVSPDDYTRYNASSVSQAVKGLIYQQITVSFDDSPFELSVRLYNSSQIEINQHIEVALQAGPLPENLNIASSFSLNRDTKHKGFWNKENGFQSQNRFFNDSARISANFQPFTSKAWIEGVMSVVTVDPRAITSKGQGDLEWTWHRRNTLGGRGNDPSKVKSYVWVSLGSSSNQFEKSLANDFLVTALSFEPLMTSWSALQRELSGSLHLVSHAFVDHTLRVQIENLDSHNSTDIHLPSVFRSTQVSQHSISFLYSQSQVSQRKKWAPFKPVDFCVLSSSGTLSIGPNQICSFELKL